MPVLEVRPIALSPKSAAVFLAISRSQLYLLLAEGKVTARKSGHRTLIDYSSAKAYFDSLPEMVVGVPMPNAPKSRHRHKAVR